ncbi:MAG: hypothetical protein H6697_03095 [Myxococcales bacterium]|nr:hypothetical protein [Myxococcales bacterium]MCB9520680.1 hypothetical protein [Myxococcales bacterium]
MRAARVIALILAACAAACTSAPEELETGAGLTAWELASWTPGDDRLIAEAVGLVDVAEHTAWVAADVFTSTDLADALVAAQGRGVDVRVVGDADVREQAGFARLAELLQAVDGQKPLRFGDGAMVYNPNLELVARPGEHSLMTENFIVVDERRVLTVTGGFGPSDVYQAGLRATSSYMGRDFADEFSQMYAGIFASTVDGFSSPLKSITDNRETYDSLSGRAGVAFGPQERLVKRLIDEIYAARSSIFVVAEALSSTELAAALRYKAEAGFEVSVVVSDDGVDAPYSRFADLERAFADLDNARIGRVAGVRFSGVLVDGSASPIDGRTYERIAMFTTHPLLPSTATVTGSTTTSRAADAFTDATLFSVIRHPTDPRYAAGEDRVLFDRIAAEVWP